MWLVIIIILDGFLSTRKKLFKSIHVYWSYRANKTQFSKSVVFQPKTKISPKTRASKIVCMWLVIIIILDGFLHGNIWRKGFEGKSIFTSEVYTVLKVEYFLYIIQIMLQYTLSFNKVCYTLRLQGCFLTSFFFSYYDNKFILLLYPYHQI
jgi:hypothetical protein